VIVVDADSYRSCMAGARPTGILESGHHAASKSAGEAFTVDLSGFPYDLCGWGFSSKHGCINIGQNTEIIARKAAALFVSLWLRGFSASFADKLMDEYIVYLQRQENKSLTFLAKVLPRDLSSEWCYFQLTREGVCEKAPINYVLEEKIIDALGKPNNNEEIIVTFAKRKKHG